VKVDPGSVLESLGPARRFADPEAPRKARLMASKGTLPLPPEQVTAVLFALTLDPDQQVREQATQSLVELPERVVETALDADLHPAALAFFAERFHEDETRLMQIALNPAAADESFCRLASLPFPAIVDVVSRNQTRLLRCPELVEVLGENPVTTQATIDRVLEFLGLVRRQAEKQEQHAQEPPPPSVETDAPAIDPHDASSLPETLLEEPTDTSQEAADERTKSLSSLLLTMTVIDKIKLARFGNQEARGLLIRDRNKLVANAAIRSPKLSENEVAQFARARNVSDEVLRIISNTGEWTKSYPVKLALTTNPKTPIASAIKFLNYLTDRDLKNITRSRDVSSPVVAHARRILGRKGKS